MNALGSEEPNLLKIFDYNNSVVIEVEVLSDILEIERDGNSCLIFRGIEKDAERYEEFCVEKKYVMEGLY